MGLDQICPSPRDGDYIKQNAVYTSLALDQVLPKELQIHSAFSCDRVSRSFKLVPNIVKVLMADTFDYVICGSEIVMSPVKHSE